MEDNGKNRYRLWFLLLYKDAENYNYKDVLFNLKSYKNYAFIEHQPEEGEKKEHTHFLLKLDNACTKEALSKKTGLPINYIQNGKNERALCRYLLHADDENKIQYDENQVKVSRNYQRHFKKHFEDLETEDVIISNIYKEIDLLCCIKNDLKDIYPIFIQWININCYDTIYRRYKQEFKDYLNLSL